MRCFDNGCLYTVTVTAGEVYDFAVRWPCAHMRYRNPVTFQFDKRNGDLIDTNAHRNHPNADDAAILALSQDAQAYGKKRLGLRD